MWLGCAICISKVHVLYPHTHRVIHSFRCGSLPSSMGNSRSQNPPFDSPCPLTQNARVGRFVFVQKYSPSREPTLRGSSEHTRVCSRATRVVMRTRSVRSTSVLPPRVALASLRRRQAWPPATQGAASVRPPLVASQKGRYRFFLPPPAKIFCKYESSFLGLLAAASASEKCRKIAMCSRTCSQAPLFSSLASTRGFLSESVVMLNHSSHTQTLSHSPLTSCRLLARAAAAFG